MTADQKRVIVYILTGVFLTGLAVGYLWNQFRNAWGVVPR